MTSNPAFPLLEPKPEPEKKENGETGEISKLEMNDFCRLGAELTSLRVPAEEFVRLHEAISFVEPGSYKFARPIRSEFHKMRLLRLSLMPTQVLAMTDFAS